MQRVIIRKIIDHLFKKRETNLHNVNRCLKTKKLKVQLTVYIGISVRKNSRMINSLHLSVTHPP